MASPFVLLFWLRACTAWSRGIASLLLLVLVYAILVTFSRGLYAAVFVSVLVFAVLAAPWRAEGASAKVTGAADGRPARALAWPLLGLPIAAVAVFAWLTLGTDSFLLNRLLNTDKVWAGRMVHWANSLALLRSPADWLLGIGLGRFPARYAGTVADGDFPGAVRLGDSAADGAGASPFVSLQGPSVTDEKGGAVRFDAACPSAGGRALRGERPVPCRDTGRIGVASM